MSPPRDAPGAPEAGDARRSRTGTDRATSSRYDRGAVLLGDAFPDLTIVDGSTWGGDTGRACILYSAARLLLHVTVDEPTQGCISIAQAQLVRLLRWLTPARHPRILIGA
jgi:hypothetical protein